MTLQEFFSTLWRRRLIIVVSVVVAVAAAFAYSKVVTPKYQSTALVQQTSSTASTSSGQSSSPVNLPDPVQELGSTAVQVKAAQILKDPNLSALTAAVTGTADPTTGTLTITASASDAAQAQAIAKAYSQAYVDQIQALVQAQVDKINGQLQSLQSQITDLNGKPSTPVTQAQIQGLTSSYSSLQTELSNITFGEPYASIQVAAGLPTKPSGLGKSKLLAIGALAGLLVGCGIALGREQLDTRLRTSPDIEAVTEAPVLAELPQDHDVKGGKVAIAMVQAPQSLMAESIRELRTSLRVILHDVPCPLIVVTSPEPGDGKTFVTANLAAAWAMSGSKVIVVSADFRRPRLEEIFGLETTGLPGLADLIRSNWKDDEQAGGHSHRHIRTATSGDFHWSPGGTRTVPDPSAPPTRGRAGRVVGQLVAGGERHLGPPGAAGRHPAREPERTVRQPRHATGARSAPPAGRHRVAGHPTGAGGARHRHPGGRGLRRRGRGLGGANRSRRPRTGDAPAGSHPLPRAGHRRQPGPPVRQRPLPVLRPQAMSRPATAGAARPVAAGEGRVMAGIDVVVVAFGAPELLERCLATLGDTYPVLVVDNSSDAAVRAVAERHGAGYVDPGENLGFAGGVNLGLAKRERSTADVLLLNPDASITPEGVAQLASRLHATGDLAGVAPAQVDTEGEGGTGRLALPHAGRRLGRGGRPRVPAVPGRFLDRLRAAHPLERPGGGRTFRRAVLPLRRGDRLAAAGPSPGLAGGAVPRGGRHPRGSGNRR